MALPTLSFEDLKSGSLLRQGASDLPGPDLPAPDFTTGGLAITPADLAHNPALRTLMYGSARQLYRRVRIVAQVSSLSYFNQTTGLPLPPDLSCRLADRHQAPRHIHQRFRQAVLTATAHSLRQRQAQRCRETVKILDVEIDNLAPQEFLAQLKRGVVYTPNVDHLMKLQHDAEFMAAYQQADYRVCDSQVLLYAAQFLGKPIKAKISGSDLFPLFCEHHRDNLDISIFLLGGGPGVAQQAQERINARTGRPIIVAAHSPSFGFEKNEAEGQEILQRIRRSGANVLVVGVGAPKQEIWIARYRAHLPQIDIFLAVGAAIDFEAGNKPRAPEVISDLGMEWLYRLWSEPRRLWRRYLVDDLPFLRLVMREKLRDVGLLKGWFKPSR
jgi:N-acetylglucosaminyldiphosphoundecaprenol N-acetyl-beta-D-mannosaminyltransferase